jgi:hypothetical protein
MLMPVSRWKRSLKGGAAYEDDLLTPAHALTPGAEEEFKEAGGKKGKKPGKTGGGGGGGSGGKVTRNSIFPNFS